MAKTKSTTPVAPMATTSMLHMLHRASQYSEELFMKASAPSDLTPRQLIVLEIVAAEEKPSQTMICAKSGIDRSTLADVVKRLVSRGLLVRRRAPDDARAYAVRITDEGRRVLSQSLPPSRCRRKAAEQHAIGRSTRSLRRGPAPDCRRLRRPATRLIR